MKKTLFIIGLIVFIFNGISFAEKWEAYESVASRLAQKAREEISLTKKISFEVSLRQDSYSYEHLGSQQPFTKDLLNDKSLVMKLINNERKMYIYGGISKTEFQWGSQPLSDITIYSIGLGIEKEVFKGFKVYVQGGWYQPKTKDLDSTWEAECYYAIEQLHGVEYLNPDVGKGNSNDPLYFPNRSFEIDGNIGGEIGLDFNIKSFISLNIAWRILSLHHYTKFWDDEYVRKYNGWWEFNQTVNYGGPSIGLTVRW